MKKQGIFLLLMLTFLFTGFVLGFFIGRNTDHGDVRVSFLPDPTVLTQPIATTGQPASQPSVSPTPAGKVNINTATKEQLMTLPGIGSMIADNIIAYRAEHGPYQSTADLLLVDLIGEKRLETIIDLITV